METCVKNSGGNKPNATSCGRVFIDGIYEHECLVRTNNYIFVKTENRKVQKLDNFIESFYIRILGKDYARMKVID